MLNSRIKEPSVIILIEDLHDEFFLGYIHQRLRSTGIRATTMGIVSGSACRGRGGLTTRVTAPSNAVEPRLFDGVIIPVSYAPRSGRMNHYVIRLLRVLARTGKTIAALTISFRTVWLMASADILRGRRLATSPSGADLAIRAGGILVDDDVVSDGRLVTGARPTGISRFMTVVTNILLGSGEIDPLFKTTWPKSCGLPSYS